jgi:hypothetical protein
MWTWTRPRSLQSGYRTPDLEPRLREQSLDAADDPYALIDTANLERPPLPAESPVPPLPFSAQSLATAGLAANCLKSASDGQQSLEADLESLR